jgi:hypothetical protein
MAEIRQETDDRRRIMTDNRRLLPRANAFKIFRLFFPEPVSLSRLKWLTSVPIGCLDIQTCFLLQLKISLNVGFNRRL